MANNVANITAVITAEDKASATIKGVGSNINREATKIGVGIAAIGAGLTLATKGAIDYTKELVTNTKKLSRETGTSTEQASALIYVTKRLGIDAEQASQSFGIFSKNIHEAATQTGASVVQQEKLKIQIDKTKLAIKETKDEIAKNGDKTGELGIKVRELTAHLYELEHQSKQNQGAFAELGINVKKADGTLKGFSELLLETADRFKAMPDGANKTAIALELFGRSGKDMIKVLNLGSQGIKDLEQNAQRMGLTLSSQNVAQVSRFIESQKNLSEVTQSLKIQIGLLTTPVLTTFQAGITQVAMNVVNAQGPFRDLLATLIAFGGPIFTASGALISFGANISQIISALGGLGVGLRAVAAFMAGPLGVAFLALGAVVGIATAQFFKQTSQLQQLKAAQDAAAQSSLNLEQAQLSEKQAALNVKTAQQQYNDAVRQYGPKSIQAQQASLNLKQAQLALKMAHSQTKQALDDLAKKQREAARQKQLYDRMQADAGAAQTLAGALGQANGQISLYNTLSKSSGSPRPGPSLAQPTSNSALQILSGHRAAGGPVNVGEAYMVGERGPEIIMPRQAGTVIPTDKINTGGGRAVSFNVHIGMFAGTQMEYRNVAKAMFRAFQDVAKQYGVTPADLLNGTNGVMIR